MSEQSYAEVKEEYFRKIQRNDRVAQWLIVVGGIGIIGIVIGMLMIIASVAMPLFRKASIEELAAFNLPADTKLLGLGVDEYKETGYYIRQDGSVVFYTLPDGEVIDELLVKVPGGGESTIKSVTTTGFFQHTYLWENGAAALVQVDFFPEFPEKGGRIIRHHLKMLSTWEPVGEVPLQTLIKGGGEVNLRVDILPGNNLLLSSVLEKENPITEEITRSVSSGGLAVHMSGNITSLTVNRVGSRLFVATDGGQVGRWDIANLKQPKLLDKVEVHADGRVINDIALVLGDESLVIGDETGHLETWMPVRTGENASKKTLNRVHTLPGHEAAIVQLEVSRRNKTIFSADETGRIRATFLTSERGLYEFKANGPVQVMAMNRRGNAFAYSDENGLVEIWGVHAPHPETSWKTLFGKVHYESYDEPDYVWQSSSASDDFEPKMSMRPLILGTLKGTMYAMLFAAPLAILGALYTSQFMHKNWRNRVKPAVEIMAAVPSVVIGFLAGLWLAPLFENRVVGTFAVMMVLPLMLVLSFTLISRYSNATWVRHVTNGKEFIGLVPVLITAVFLSMALGGLVENTFFNGDFKQYVYDWLELRVDQRNCIVIAFALGFAVIPVIFTLADDALSAVPQNLTAASLALGASRWQTAWKVVLPSASPGIFAALMIGLGRAVGETMIVLMATGNTPIMDMSIFNGMRTLSANIAVEIPEAPQNGTLYRTLFLSAVILFIFTFMVNTVAEMVRIRLRAKYGNY